MKGVEEKKVEEREREKEECRGIKGEGEEKNGKAGKREGTIGK